MDVRKIPLLRLTLTLRSLCIEVKNGLIFVYSRCGCWVLEKYQMRSAAEVTTTASARNIDLLDNVDYRLAETPEEREEIYRLRYRA